MPSLAEAESLDETSPYHKACIASDEARGAYWRARNKLPSEAVEALDEDLGRLHDDWMKLRDDRITQFEADHGLTELAAAMNKADAICAEYEPSYDDEDD